MWLYVAGSVLAVVLAAIEFLLAVRRHRARTTHRSQHRESVGV
jgi:hypothetical protein